MLDPEQNTLSDILHASDSVLERILLQNTVHGAELGIFISTTSEILLETLEKKKKQLTLRSTGTKLAQASCNARGHLFIANNALYILKTIEEYIRENNETTQPESLLQVAHCVKQRYEDAVDAFCSTGWDIVMAHVSPIEEESLQFTKGKITFDSGRLLKTRFENFNSDLEELLAVEKRFSVPDSILRAKLRVRIANKFIPHAEFFERFSTIPFSKKHQEQYLRYSPKVIHSLISSLFI